MSISKNFQICLDSSEIQEFISQNPEIKFVSENSTLGGFPLFTLEAPREILFSFLDDPEIGYSESEINEMIQD